MIRVKICGITNITDALHAEKCGADALGFNFYAESSRYVRPSAASSISEQLSPETDRVGVFVNDRIERIADIAAAVGLSAIQLHGDEDPAFVDGCSKRTGLPVIKAFRVSPEFSVETVLNYQLDSILLDAFCPAEVGGTGKVFDWAAAVDVRACFPKLYLAGGLSAVNVADAIRAVKPFAVDACSLLESEPGKKDHQKVMKFISAAKEAI